MKDNMTIIGICRFSMIGRGDWKAYRNIEEGDLERIYQQKEQELFDDARMEARFLTFEQLTLASLDAQADQDFKLLVISSDRMPQTYRERLKKLCSSRPYVILRFVAPMHVADAQTRILDEMGLELKDCLQFRLDDDDCLSKDYIRKLRKHGDTLWKAHGAFAVSYPTVIYSVMDGPTQGLYRWFNPFLGVGVAVRHPQRTVFGFAHYRIPTVMVALTDPSVPSIVTHYGMNDTPRHAKEILAKRGMKKSSRDELARLLTRHFDFLTEKGIEAAGLNEPPARRRK